VSARASGAIPGLLRRCSPVVLLRGPFAGSTGVVSRVIEGERRAIGQPNEGKECDSVRVNGEFNGTRQIADLALDLTDATGLDHGARFVAEKLLDASWGTIEGVVCHMSWRGYLEIYVWTTKLRGRPLEINVGDRFTTRLPGTFEAFEERNRTHGWGEFAIGTPSEPADRAEALALAIAHVAGVAS
jgi:hypothetical protein